MLGSTEFVQAKEKITNALNEIPVSDLLLHQQEQVPILAFHENTAIKDILKHLSVQGSPTCLIFKHEFSEKVYTGLCSIYEILSLGVIEGLFDVSDFKTHDQNPSKNYYSYLNNKVPEIFFGYPIKKVVNLCGDFEKTRWVLHSSDSLGALTRCLTDTKHRKALIVDCNLNGYEGGIPENASLKIVSATELIQYLQLSKLGGTKFTGELLSPILYLSIDELNGLDRERSRPMVAILETQSARHGFRTMFMNNLRSVPVVDNSGRVVGNLNASDVNGYDLPDENISVHQFIMLQNGMEKLRTIPNTNSLNSAIENILANNASRLWVTKDAGNITGCVSTTDILRLCA